MYLHQGKIFWHEVPNRGQTGSKRRPLIILTPTREASDHKIPSVVCVACSHSAAQRDPLPAHCVLLPEKIGKRQTKLGQETVAVCDWRLEVEKEKILPGDLAGSIGEEALSRVLETVERCTGPAPLKD